VRQSLFKGRLVKHFELYLFFLLLKGEVLSPSWTAGGEGSISMKILKTPSQVLRFMKIERKKRFLSSLFTKPTSEANLPCHALEDDGRLRFELDLDRFLNEVKNEILPDDFDASRVTFGFLRRANLSFRGAKVCVNEIRGNNNKLRLA
jgi:hypothetical protein